MRKKIVNDNISAKVDDSLYQDPNFVQLTTMTKNDK